ncbi:PrgI family protein [Ruthenibacterium lactatiformans]|uniref:PrgI family protein n=1 Tax=Ruthenibacterium lactatiformans TaxID=1550024 RepID=UPI003A92D7A0
MEIKVPKEVRQYHESIFFGLSLRQFGCSLAAVGAAVGMYFGCVDTLGTEATGWVCIFGAAPLALAGFFTYNGMPLEKFLWAVFKSQVLRARPRVFRAKNYWYIFFCEKGRLEKPAALFKYKRKEGKKKDETEMETV